MTYFSNIKRGIRTTVKGLSLTLKHLWASRRSKGDMDFRKDQFFQVKEGNVTLQYPHQNLPIPDLGRYKLDCEIDDCIVCDKCAKVCPVNCIEIEAIKSPDIISYASDGSAIRLHAAKFNIDMAKCCYCGLCTTVCPTECLTMTGEFDYSVQNVDLLNFAFAKLSTQEAQEKKALYEQFVAEKEAAKKAAPLAKTTVAANKPVFKPKAKPAVEISEEERTSRKPNFTPKSKQVAQDEQVAPPTFDEISSSEENISPKSKPAFVPKAKPTISELEEKANEVDNKAIEENHKASFTPKAKPTFIPKAKPAINEAETNDIDNKATEDKPKANFTPKAKPAFVLKAKPAINEAEEKAIEDKPKASFTPKAKPAFVPKAKPAINEAEANTNDVDNKATEDKPKASFTPKAKPAFVPKQKPKDS